MQTRQQDRENATQQVRAGQSGRDPQASVRARRNADAPAASEQQYDPKQFSVSSAGVVSLKTQARPTEAVQYLDMVATAHGTGAVPSVELYSNMIVLHFENGEAAYPFFDIPEAADHTKTARLVLRWTCETAAVTAATVTVDTFPVRRNQSIPTTAEHTASKSFTVPSILYSQTVTLPVPLHKNVDSLHLKVSTSGILPASAKLHLHGASIHYPLRYAHVHEAD